MFHQNVRGGDEKMSTHALQERQAYDIIKDLRFLAFRAKKTMFCNLLMWYPRKISSPLQKQQALVPVFYCLFGYIYFTEL